LAHEMQSTKPVPDALKTLPVRSYRIQDGTYQPMKCEALSPQAFVRVDSGIKRT
jgi:hypothetical protein